MATKPTVSPPIFASDVNYLAGALVDPAIVGDATKILPTGVRLTHGHIPNTPPFAEHSNYVLNNLCLWGEWVFAGRGIKEASIHIQETGDEGEVSAVGADFGDFVGSDFRALRVRPNHDQLSSGAGMLVETVPETDAVAARFEDVSTGFDRRALQVRCTGEGSVAPFHIDATYDDGGGVGNRPAMHIEGNNTSSVGAIEIDVERGTAIKVRATGTMTGVPGVDVQLGDSASCYYGKQLSGNQPTARFEAFDGGANANAPLLLVPQAFDVAGSGAQSGSVWIHKLFDIVDHFALQAYLGNSVRHIVHTRHPWCYAEAMTTADVVTLTDDDANIWTSVISASFADDQVPHAVGTVVVTVHGEVARELAAATITAISGLDLEVLDDTNVATALDKEIDLAPLETSDANNQIFVGFTANQYYTMPAAGKTTFTCRIKTKAGQPTGQRLKVRRVRLIIQALP